MQRKLNIEADHAAETQHRRIPSARQLKPNLYLKVYALHIVKYITSSRNYC